MPVKLFYTPQVQPQQLFQDSLSETLIFLSILRKIAAEIAEHHGLHAIIVNIGHQEWFADLIVVSEHGMGLMTFQHEPGNISRDKDVWCANGQPVTVNSRLGYRNPHAKVQQCADKIREKLIKPTGAPWLQGRPITWQDLFFDTAVCFTHPEVKLDLFRKYYTKEVQEGQHVKEWERFSLLERDEVARWIRNLCFEKDLDDLLNVQSYRLTTTQILRIVTDFFKAKELPPLPEPQAATVSYGYIVLKEHGEVTARFQLHPGQMTVGRDPEADVAIPKKFINVSRIHARVTCSKNGISIEDCSRNGTFVNGDRIYVPTPLRPGQHVFLGGNQALDGVCELEFAEQ